MIINRDNMFLISGKMASGKSTVSKYLSTILHNSVLISLADPIYQISSWWENSYLLYQYNNMKDAEELLKQQLIELYKDKNIARKAKIKLLDYMTIYHSNASWSFKDTQHRQFLQDVGVLLREVEPMCIIDNLISRSKKLTEEGKIILCDDARYKPEVFSLSEGGFTTIRLNISRETQIQRLVDKYQSVNYERLNHLSETDLDDYKNFNYIIDANQSLDIVNEIVSSIIIK